MTALTKPVDTSNTGALLDRLASIGLTLTGTLDLEGVFKALRAQSAALLDASTFMLWWREDDSPTLVLRLGDELGKPLPPERVSLDDPEANVARCARERTDVVMNLKAGEASSQHIDGTEVMLSALFGALVVDDRVMGVLSVQSPRENAYGDTQRHIFRTLCTFGAIGINNADAYRKLADTREALASLHDRYRDVIEHVSEAICIYQDGRIVLANTKACQLTGYAHDELLGKTFEATTYADDVEATAAWIRAHFKRQPVARYHRLRVRRFDGAPVWTEASMAVVTWNGRIAALAVFADLTERLATEQAMRRSEERYRTLVTHATDGILVVQDNAVVFANPRAEAIAGGPLTGEHAIDFFDRVHRNDRPLVLERFQQLLAGGLGHLHAEREAFRLIDAQGQLRWLEVSAVCIEWERRPAALAFVVDVTERWKLEQQVKTNLAEAKRAQVVLDNVAEAIVVSVEDRIVFSNPSAQRLLQGDNETLGQRSIFKRIHPDDHQTVLQQYRQRRNGEREVYGFEIRLVAPDGTLTWVDLRGVPIEWDGQAASLALINDVTERRRLEQSVRQSLQKAVQAKEAADAASRAKSEFLAMMSHEIRTPIAGVIGMQSFALRDTSLSAKTRHQLELAHNNAQALLTLLNDVLDLSKIEAGKLDVESIDFNLHSLLDDVISLLGERAASKSISLHMHIDPGVPVHVRGDPTRLRQVLVNLLGNAVKFTEEGSVTLHVHHKARVGSRTRLDFEVRDTGIGMDDDALARLFQKFEQADNSTTRRYGGTGLGLAITRQLVGLMGGNVSVDSMRGRGSTFHVHLTLPDGVAPIRPHDGRRQPHDACLRVLCAEDFPTNQLIIRTLLEDGGHEVEVVDNGLLALQALHERRFDLVLMDGRMPEMDGSTATRWIRRGGPPEAPIAQRDIPIVALTANASEEDRQRYLSCGMDDFIAKPINEGVLHDTLARVITTLRARGATLAPARSAPSVADLDAMFGLQADAPPVPHTPTQQAAPASSTATPLPERLRLAYARDLPQRLAHLTQALQARDTEAASMGLHGLKGSTGFLAPDGEAHALCSSLEQATLRGDWSRADADWPTLQAALLALAETA